MVDWEGDVGRRLQTRLVHDHLVWLTTVGPDGTPYPSVVWFWWSGDDVLVYSMESQRISNIEANPRVALNFNSDEGGGSVAVVSGIARVDRSHPAAPDHSAYVEKYRDRIENGLGMSIEAFSQRYHLPVLIRPVRGRAW